MNRLWVRFEHAGRTGFGTLEGERVREHAGELFGANDATATTHALPTSAC